MEKYIKTDLPIKFKIKNTQRKWYQLWDKRWLVKEFTVKDLDLHVCDELIDHQKGDVIYEVRVDAKDIRMKTERLVKEVLEDVGLRNK